MTGRNANCNNTYDFIVDFPFFDIKKGFGHLNNNLGEFIKDVRDGYEVHKATRTMGRMDVMEDDNNYYVVVEIPGVAKEDVKIVLKDENRLEISGTRKPHFEANEENKGKMLICECGCGEFNKIVELGDKPLDKEKVSAKFVNGELHITVAKKEEEKPEHFEIPIE